MTFVEKMDQYIDAYTDLYRFSGMLRITQRDQIVYQRNVGYADIEQKVPFSTSSVFTLYSISKPFCAIGLLRLAEKGLVDINAHPSKYLKEAEGADSRITIRHLMHHISGLRDFSEERSFIERSYQTWHCPDMRQAVAEIVRCPLNFQPGEGSQYANINFTIQALIIENVSGMKYADYMATEVFAPLGMKNTRIDQLGLLIDHRVRGYGINGGEIISVERVSPDFFIGAGDVISTIEDVYRLNHAIKHRLLLKPETWDMVLTPSPVNVFGMGCQVVDWHGKTRIQHNGGSSGFRTLHIYVPEDDLDIILLSNFGFGDARWSFVQAIYTAFYGDAASDSGAESMDSGYITELYRSLPDGFLPKKKPKIELSAEAEAAILGVYESPVDQSRSVVTKEEDGTYCITSNGWQKLYCYPTGNDVLANCYIDEAYKILRDQSGRVMINGKIKIG